MNANGTRRSSRGLLVIMSQKLEKGSLLLPTLLQHITPVSFVILCFPLCRHSSSRLPLINSFYFLPYILYS